MKVQSLFCVLTGLSLVFIGGTMAGAPDKKPLKDKDAELEKLNAELKALRQAKDEPKDQARDTEVKELVAELKTLRQRVDKVETRLAELRSVPVLLRMEHAAEVKTLNAPLRHGKLAQFFISLHTDHTDQKKSRPVPVRDIFKAQPFHFEVEIPHEDAKQPPLRVPGRSDGEDCEGSHEMYGYFLVPKEAKVGNNVPIKIFWPAYPRIAEGSKTMSVYLIPTKK